MKVGTSPKPRVSCGLSLSAELLLCGTGLSLWSTSLTATLSPRSWRPDAWFTCINIKLGKSFDSISGMDHLMRIQSLNQSPPILNTLPGYLQRSVFLCRTPIMATGSQYQVMPDSSPPLEPTYNDEERHLTDDSSTDWATSNDEDTAGSDSDMDDINQPDDEPHDEVTLTEPHIAPWIMIVNQGVQMTIYSTYIRTVHTIIVLVCIGFVGVFLCVLLLTKSVLLNCPWPWGEIDHYLPLLVASCGLGFLHALVLVGITEIRYFKSSETGRRQLPRVWLTRLLLTLIGLALGCMNLLASEYLCPYVREL